MSKDRRLGRGLAALLGDVGDGQVPSDPDPLGGGEEYRIDRAARADGHSPAEAGSQWLQLSVHQIDQNPFQPRRDFDPTDIASLAESLQEHEMLQPILVRRVGERFQLISGERRLRAAVHAGWSTIPAQVREADDRLVAELAIVENLQRKDLNPIEKAMSFKRYLDQHQCAQEELASRLRIDRSTVANMMRLLELPEPVLQAVREGRLSAGHARALLPLGDESVQGLFAEQIVQHGWSVRETERQVQIRITAEDGGPLHVVGRDDRVGRVRPRSRQLASLEQELRSALGTQVEIRQNAKGRGRIIIHFTSHEEFDRLRAAIADSTAAARRAVG